MSKQDPRGGSAQGIGRFFLLLILMALSLIFGFDLLELESLRSDEPSASVSSSQAGWYQIHFTNPDCPPEEERTRGLDETIAADIRAARSQVDVAAFDLDAEPIVDALIELEQRQVLVRVVTDEDNSDLPSIRRLRRNGISVVEDGRSARMHNKFVVIDGRFLWTGSMNLTSNGAYCNNNNMVRFDSPELALNYTVEMDEMYVDRAFGPTSPDNTPGKSLLIEGVPVRNHFASEEEVAPLLAELVRGARSEILFMAFSFTEETLGEAMLQQASAGLTIRGVFETAGSDTEFSYFPEMASAGLANLQVRQDGNARIMHHKVIIIDRQTVIFGSYNFSASANDSNDENVLIVSDDLFASRFIEEFETIWSASRA